MAFRIILAIPQFIVLYILVIAAFFVLVIGWFAALFTGRLPEWAHTFLSGVIRWYTRVGAYMFLLTDRYPPFSLDDVEYPVRPILPGRGPLNRVSVFFRIILAIPAAVFYEIVLNGLTFPLLFVMWIVVLITGSMPPALYDAYAALLRYQIRFHSWFSMITSEYAWGMLGDFVPPPTTASTAPPLGDRSPAPAAPPPPTPTNRWRLPGHRQAIRSPRRSPRTPPRTPPRRPQWPLTAARPTDRSARFHAAPIAVGAHVDPVFAGSAAPVGHPRPPGGGAGLDDLRHRLGLDRLRRPERRPRRREQQPQQPFDVRSARHGAPGHVRAQPRHRPGPPTADAS